MEEKSYFLTILRTLPKTYQTNYIRYNIIKNCPELFHSNYYDISSLCRVCGFSYAVHPRSLQILPPRKLNRFLRRISKDNFMCRTPYQIESLENLKKYSSSQTLVKTCDICHYIQKGRLKKTHNEQENVPETPKKIKISRKNKKNNEYAGLNKDAVLSVKKRKLGSNYGDFTPKKSKLDEVILLDTPTSSVCSLIDDNDSKSNESNNAITPNVNTSIINLISPETKKSKKKNKKSNEVIDTRTCGTNQNNVSLTLKKKGRKQKKSNIILESEKKSTKKEKMNVLKSLIKETEIANKSSNLQLFLQSIPSY